ncbi:Aste57867_22134 [Aphanomyces stellatus]|uniref:Aste57867_22134 protein n=1 Tax=Aphanomyces stellatus TaxID=120398 RepID=A0A485LJN1_9STRA|nr:hypothetical protein As57867_022065 [Aphanomyces stellatus]VFT98802.1 Aste57867_22134 [Aphanomyces stellatus]
MVATSNPLLADWSARPFSLPPFEETETHHFQPAIEVGIVQHLDELRAIAENADAPTFDNTIAALDRAGALLTRVLNFYSNLTASCSSKELQQLERALVGPLSDHNAKAKSTPGLFARIKAVHDARDTSDLNPEQTRLVERIYTDYVRGGAAFDAETQATHDAIVKELSQLMTTFRQNITADEGDVVVQVTKDELVGTPDYLIAAADRGADGYVVTLARSMVEPFLTLCPNADARERVWQKWNFRGELSVERDNNPIAVRILELRQEQARLHGFRTFAEFQTSDMMAKTPDAVLDLLNKVWVPARAAALEERKTLEAYAASIGADTLIRPSDWRFYAEKVRAETFNVDDAQVKPYFSLERMTAAVMDCAHKLYNLRFVLRPDIKAYHPDVNVYEVHDESQDDEIIAVFLHDNYSRPFKRGGAWMSSFRLQSRNVDDKGTAQIPVIINNNNFTKGAPLSFNNVKTLFHEFGHGLHGILSNVTYNRLAGTQVPKDFVELPSQLMEHWHRQPEVLAKHARHNVTNEPLPADLLEKVTAAMRFQQGFATVEHVACTLVDQALHALEDVDGLDMRAFEDLMLTKLEMPQGIVMRHRIPHFNHLFGGSAYAAGYFVYLWAAVLDADAFEAFVEAGDVFDKTTADRARQFIYSSGNTRDQMSGYRAFRGRDPTIDALMKKKGFA